MPDRMAGGAFAFAADPPLLAAHTWASRAATISRRCRRKALPSSCCICRPTALSAPMSPFRTRSARWRCRRRTPAPARSAPPIRCGTTAASCARPIPTSKASSTISTPAAPGWDAAGEALVLGAGGSARAVVFGLIERGIKRVHLANRTIDRARALADQFGAGVDPVAWDAIGDLLPDAGLLGQHHLARHARPAPACDRCRAGCRQQAVVADLVYVPLETALLAAARARGLRTADGLGMLLHQAVRGFELWFGQRPAGHARAARAGRGRSRQGVSRRIVFQFIRFILRDARKSGLLRMRSQCYGEEQVSDLMVRSASSRVSNHGRTSSDHDSS